MCKKSLWESEIWSCYFWLRAHLSSGEAFRVQRQRLWYEIAARQRYLVSARRVPRLGQDLCDAGAERALRREHLWVPPRKVGELRHTAGGEGSAPPLPPAKRDRARCARPGGFRPERAGLRQVSRPDTGATGNLRRLSALRAAEPALGTYAAHGLPSRHVRSYMQRTKRLLPCVY